MRSIERLYEERQLGERTDLTARVLAVVAGAFGSFRRRLPAAELTEAEFLKALVPQHFDTMAEYLAAQAARPKPWKNLPPDFIPEKVVEAADAAVSQHFSFLGCDFHFREGVDWLHSPGASGARNDSASGARNDSAVGAKTDSPGSWPRRLWSEVQFADISHLGDIKPCWEMNRHQFFVTLALASLKTADPKYAAAVTRFINGWCDQNTPETGVNYISGFEISLRCISWVFADRLLTGVAGYDEKTRARLHCNLYSQARHIAEYLSSTQKAAANHRLLGEAAALAWLALTHPEWQASEKWLQRALNVLWPALDAQVSPDGVHFETSCGYQLQVVEFLLLLFTEMRRQKKPVPSKCYEILEKMGTALRLTRQPDGLSPNINDNDDGAVLPLPLSPPDRLESIIAVLAALYDRPDFKASAAHKFDLYGHLLLGEAGAEEFRIVAEVPDETPFLAEFRTGGLHVLRRKGDYLLLKNNPDPFPRSGHNHADLLSILLFLDGRQVLADAGTYRFSDDRGVRNALRGTAAHNTVTVDGRGQAVPLRNFDWASAVTPGLTHVQDENDFAAIDARHDSYLDSGVAHRRLVLWLKAEEILLVADQLSGNGMHTFDQSWHFPPGARVEERGPWNYRVSDETGPLAFLRFLRAKDIDRHEILAGSEKNPTTLISHRYGEVEPGIVLKYSWLSALKADHASLRLAVFTKKEQNTDCRDTGPVAFRFGNWEVDLGQTPARVTRIKK